MDRDDPKKIALVTVLRHHLLTTHDKIPDLAERFELPARENDRGHHLKKFLESKRTFDENISRKIFHGFCTTILTPQYRTDVPPYIQLAINTAFGETLPPASPSSMPINVIARIQDYNTDRLDQLSRVFQGTWDIVRYSHHGERVVRGAMDVRPPMAGLSLPTFTIYFRTNHLTETKSETVYKTEGSLFVLAHSIHVCFLGCEDAGYPLTIIAPLKDDHDEPFWGLVQRRHHGAKVVFAIKAHFSRAAVGTTIDTLKNERKIGSWSDADTDAMATMRGDIPGLDNILAKLRDYLPRGRGGIILDDD